MAIRHWYEPAMASEALRMMRLPSASRAKRPACSWSRIPAPTEMIWLEVWSGRDQIRDTLPENVKFSYKEHPDYPLE